MAKGEWVRLTLGVCPGEGRLDGLESRDGGEPVVGVAGGQAVDQSLALDMAAIELQPLLLEVPGCLACCGVHDERLVSVVPRQRLEAGNGRGVAERVALGLAQLGVLRAGPGFSIIVARQIDVLESRNETKAVV